MTSDYQLVRLGEVCRIKQGKYLSPDKMTNVSDDINSVQVVGGNGVLGYTESSTHPVDVPLVTCRGSRCGMIQWGNWPTWVSNNAMAVYFEEGEGDNYFLYHFLRLQDFDDVISGSAQPQITVSALAQKEIHFPSLDRQRAIAKTLRALDAKIQINYRIAGNLEDLASELFQSWFIDFDPVKAKMAGEEPVGMDSKTAALFPGWMEESELGKIPSGWSAVTIAEFGQVVTGKTPSTRQPRFWGDEIPFVTIPDMHNSSIISSTARCLSVEGAASQSRQSIPAGSTLVSCIASPGLVSFTPNPCHTNQQINSVIPSEKVEPAWLYFKLKALAPEIVRRSAVGSMFANLNKTSFSSIEGLLPPHDVISAFEKFGSDVLNLMRVLQSQSLSLSSLRDSLLRRLISGEVEIPDELLSE